MGGPDPQRNPRLAFRRRSKTLREKARQLSDICGAKVYLLVDHSRGKYVYNSSNDASWPPPDKTLEIHYPNLDRDPFGSTKGLQGSPPRDPNMPTPPRDPRKLRQYFAARFEVLYDLEELHKSMETAVCSAESKTVGKKQAENPG